MEKSFKSNNFYKSFYDLPLNSQVDNSTLLLVSFLNLKFFLSTKKNIPFDSLMKLKTLYLNLRLFLNRNFLLKSVNFYSSKELFFNLGLFISNSSNTIQNYRFNRGISFVNKNIYFFNVDKVLFVLNQFSSFFFKIIGLRGNMLFASFDSKDGIFMKTVSDLWGMNFIVGKWINGLFTNWLYFYRRIWELENKLFSLKTVNNTSSLKDLYRNKLIGLIGLRSMPDFIFILNSGNGLTVQNLLKEAYEYAIPVSSVVGLNDDPRYIVYPLYGDINNNLVSKFYKLVLINLFKLGLVKRVLNEKNLV